MKTGWRILLQQRESPFWVHEAIQLMTDGSRISLAILPGLGDGHCQRIQFVIPSQLAQEAESPFEFPSALSADLLYRIVHPDVRIVDC